MTLCWTAIITTALDDTKAEFKEFHDLSPRRTLRSGDASKGFEGAEALLIADDSACDFELEAASLTDLDVFFAFLILAVDCVDKPDVCANFFAAFVLLSNFTKAHGIRVFTIECWTDADPEVLGASTLLFVVEVWTFISAVELEALLVMLPEDELPACFSVVIGGAAREAGYIAWNVSAFALLAFASSRGWWSMHSSLMQKIPHAAH